MATQEQTRWNRLTRENVVGREGSCTTKRDGGYLYTFCHHKDDRRVIATKKDTIRGGGIVATEYAFHEGD